MIPSYDVPPAGLPSAPGPTPDAAAIDAILHAYRTSQALMTAVRLGLFDGLDADDPCGRPVPLGRLASVAGIPQESAAVLVAVLEGVGLLARRGGGLVATPLAAAHLTPDAPYPLRRWVESEQEKYVGFGGLAEALRAAPEPEDDARAERRLRGAPAARLEGLAEVARARGPENARIVATLTAGLGRGGRLLDAGGGHGLDAIGIVTGLPGWTAVVADRPEPVEVARANARANGVPDLVRVVEADLERDDLAALTGGGFDVAFLFMVLGGKPAPEAAAVLTRIREALAPGGWLVVRGNWTDRLRGATSALKHMLRPGGRATMTHERTLELLGEAGFVDVHTVAGEGIAPHASVAARRAG